MTSVWNVPPFGGGKVDHVRNWTGVIPFAELLEKAAEPAEVIEALRDGQQVELVVLN